MKLDLREKTPAEAEAEQVKKELYLKEVKRCEALRMLVGYIAVFNRSMDRLKYKEEARMYLEDCNYDYDAAVKKFHADVKWEEEQKKLAKANKKPGFFARLFS